MYTLCPHCSTCFRITGEQINAAQGNVRCGNCGAVFNALDNPAPEPDSLTNTSFTENDPFSAAGLFHEQEEKPLHEETGSTPEPAPPNAPSLTENDPFSATELFHEQDEKLLHDKAGTAREEDDSLHLFEEPEFVPLGEEEPSHAYSDTPDSPRSVGEKSRQPVDVELPTPTLPDNIDEEIHEYFVDDVENTTIEELEKLFLPEEEEPRIEQPPPKKEMVAAEEPQPAAPRRDTPPPFSLLTSPVTLSIGSLLLIASLLGQYVYFARDHLAQQYTELRPLLQKMCDQLGCTLPLQRDLSKLQLTHRDVRTHPTAKDALLINATFVNRAPFRQPYPAIELKLSSINGKLIGRRVFQPEEYLAGHPDIEAGIPPNTQVYLVLELPDPGRQAVNFEFDFR